jgi:putative N6-adenine-specific DNA methylase
VTSAPDVLAGALRLVATCALGLEELLEAEVRGLGIEAVERQRAAVAFSGGWRQLLRANWRLRTANRVLIELETWRAADGDALAAGARRAAAGPLAGLLHPDRRFAVTATAAGSALRDTRWVALRTKDGIVDGQRERWGRRADVERETPDLPLRLRLHGERATLLLDASGARLDARGYRDEATEAPVRETLAAACVLASGWDGRGPVVDPMCGSGTLLIEAALIALGRSPAALRRAPFACERFPNFSPELWAAVKDEPLPAPGPAVRLYGNDRDPRALDAARRNFERARLTDRAELVEGDAFEVVPPPGPGLVVVNPPYGERVTAQPGQWRALGDLLKRRFTGWRAAVLAGGEGQGKEIGLKPSRRWPVRNGPLEARILVFELY